MEQISIGKLYESDFDKIIELAGGCKFSQDDSKEMDLNADYVIGNSIIELKIIEEEGLQKTERQKKLAELFKKKFPAKPTIVLDPALLDEEESKLYLNIMSTPIKSAVKKAAKQLAATKKKLTGIESCGLLIVNNEYGALNHDEFKEIAIRRATQDTKKIDFLIIGGFYYYGDSFDHCTFPKFEPISLDITKGISHLERLKNEWQKFVDEFMKHAILGYPDREPDKLPLSDFEYEINGTRFVKLTPLMGKVSKFFPNGRPRINSTAIETVPPLAHTFPKLTKKQWEELKELLNDSESLEASYADWIEAGMLENECFKNPLQPLVDVPIKTLEFKEWVKNKKLSLSFQSLSLFANEIFESKIKEIVDNRVPYERKLYLSEYILVEACEIGQDKANDYARISIVREWENRNEIIIEDTHMFYQHAIGIGATYSMKYNIPYLVYKKDEKYKWK